MKHLQTFESFKINEEEEIFGLFTDKQKKIEQYTKEILAGTISPELKKDFESYKKAKPEGGIGSSMGTWLTYVTNVDDLVKAPAKPAAELEDAFGKKRPAAEVIEEEVARMILKDRLVTKEGGKWQVESKGRSFKGATHTFGSGE